MNPHRGSVKFIHWLVIRGITYQQQNQSTGVGESLSPLDKEDLLAPLISFYLPLMCLHQRLAQLSSHEHVVELRSHDRWSDSTITCWWRPWIAVESSRKPQPFDLVVKVILPQHNFCIRSFVSYHLRFFDVKAWYCKFHFKCGCTLRAVRLKGAQSLIFDLFGGKQLKQNWLSKTISHQTKFMILIRSFQMPLLWVLNKPRYDTWYSLFSRLPRCFLG